MITATARSSTLPRAMKALNSDSMGIPRISWMGHPHLSRFGSD